jgi:spermidine/putrescine transport system substrate-binding protein
LPVWIIAGEKPEKSKAVEEVGMLSAYDDYVSSLPTGYEPVPKECFEQAMKEGQVIFYDWAEWWPDKIFEDFTKEFGIEVRRDHFSSHAEVISKFKLHPETEYDLVVGMGTEGLERIVALDLASEINWNWAPNVNRYLPKEDKDIWTKLGMMDYSLPFCFFVEGMTYNTKYVDDPRLPSWGVLYEPLEKFKGRIVVADNDNLVIGDALIYLGYSRNSDNEDELMQAGDLLLRLKPFIMAYDIYPLRLMFEEEAWIAQAGSVSDSYVMHKEKKELTFALPSEGTSMAFDTIFIPLASPNRAAAHLFMNYLFRPDINAFLIESVGMGPAHIEVPDLLSDDIRNFPGIVNRPEGYLDKCEFPTPKSFTGKGLELRRRIWEELKK